MGSLADEDPAQLEELLVFLTGASAIPILGFQETPSISFLDDSDSRKEFPVVSTCSLTLYLPNVNSYDEFHRNFKNAMKIKMFTDH